MNYQQMALYSWKEQIVNYERSIKIVIAELSKPIKFIHSASFDARQNQLREYLKDNDAFFDDDDFYEVYVHHVAGTINMTLMQISLKLVNQLGGSVKFWQNKVLDIASNTSYHSSLTIWEVSKAFEPYLGLSPEFVNNLRKKRSLAKQYLNNLSSLKKLIQKSNGAPEDLLKFDDSFKKLKKSEQNYYAFMEEIQNLSVSKEATNISVKGKNQAKNNLFLFFKPKEEKKNTLANYKFEIKKEAGSEKASKLLKNQQYEEFNNLFSNMAKASKSQHQSIFSENSNTKFSYESEERKQVPMNQLREQFSDFLTEKKKEPEQPKDPQYVFIWRNEYYFTHWGFPVHLLEQIDFLNPFTQYDKIDYDQNSIDEFDELHAEDIDSNDDSSEQDSISHQSFVVDDDYISDEDERDPVYSYKPSAGYERWSKSFDEFDQYECINLFENEPQPLPVNFVKETTPRLEEEFLDKLQGKTRAEIYSTFQEEKAGYTKNKIDIILRNDFKKIRGHKKTTYFKKTTNRQNQEIVEGISDQQTTFEPFETSASVATKPITYPLRSRTSREIKNEQSFCIKLSKPDTSTETILEDINCAEK